MTDYARTKTGVVVGVLRMELLAAGITSATLTGIQFTSPGSLVVSYSTDLSSGDVTLMDNAITAHTGMSAAQSEADLAGLSEFFDDFRGVALDTSRWGFYSSGGGAPANSIGPQNLELGQMQLATGNAANRYVTLGLYSGITTTLWTLCSMTKCYCQSVRFRQGETATSNSYVGLSSDRTATPTDAVWFTRATTGNWQSVTRSASVSTTKDTGVVADTDWHILQITVDAALTAVYFHVDGVLKTTHTGSAENVPTVNLGTAIVHQTTDAIVKYAYIDYIRMQQRRL